MAFDRGWWDEPVAIIRGNVGITLIVNNTSQARRLLDEEWPTDEGDKFHAALVALNSAKVSPLKARLAFEAAAGEAGVLTAMPARPSPIPGFKSPTWRKRKRKLKRDI